MIGIASSFIIQLNSFKENFASFFSQNLWSEKKKKGKKKKDENEKACERLKVQCQECGQEMKTEDRQVEKNHSTITCS